MPNITGPVLSFPTRSFPGQTTGNPTGVIGEVLFSPLMAKYSTLVKSGKVFSAYATVTAPVIFSTAAGTGGPLIFNPAASGVDVHVLAVGVSVSVASAVAGAIGLTGAVSAAPGSTTAIDASGNCLAGGAAGLASKFRVGTPSNPGVSFMPVFNVGTAATSAQFISTWIDVGGAFVAPQGTFVSIAASATLTTFAAGITMIYAELPS